MGVQWTEEQQKVIRLRNRNILVSAAAGSGKTAVLVERIIQMLTDADNPVDVDQLLIVTFTEAAAAEMKERIRDAIEKELEKRPEDVHLERQATLIHSAQVTTIHSFCLSVIREHFHVIDIDPGFRIAEEGELKLLKQDVLEELLEDCYVKGEPDFLEFVEKAGSGHNDRKLEELILKLYEYSRSYPQPEKWLGECVHMYCPADGGEPLYFTKAAEQVKQYAADLQELLEQGIRICEEPDGPYMYADMLESDREMLSDIASASTFEEMYANVSAIKWKRLSAKKDESVSAEKRDQVKALREQAKKQMKELNGTYFFQEPGEMLKDMADSYGMMKVFAGLVQQFADAFAQKKKSKNMIDFSDMEQFALQILTEEKEGRLIPSLSAREYQEQFAEVMIDEYQDSNLIQEAILTSVSTVSRGKNNIFMVGDVKQSIYRFRLSRPELFMEKYDTYSTGDSDRQRIDLHKNFRSRTEVLDSVNDVFRRIMRRELGGIAYDDLAALYPGADFEPLLREDGTSANETELMLLDTSDEAGDASVNPWAETGESALGAFGRAEKSEAPGTFGRAGDTPGAAHADPAEGEARAGAAAGIEETGREAEARMVARRIQELVGTAQVKDKKSGQYRKVMYRDIVILTRSMKGWAETFSAVLMEEGIPAYAGSREGYFEAYEVSVLLDYLRLLDNQRQDVPLAAVLASPFAGLDARQMAEIRTACPEGMFFEAAEHYVQAGRALYVKGSAGSEEQGSRSVRAGSEEQGSRSGRAGSEEQGSRSVSAESEADVYFADAGDLQAPELWRRLNAFYIQLEHFREMVPYTAIHELLWKILEETGYGLYMAAMPGGEQRTANVEMLVEKAAAFEGTSYKGLFNFVRYIEQLRKYDVDYGEANIADEQADTVRIMSIHKSKGLEFPIVFVSGMGKQFNTQDMKGSVIIHPGWGVGIDAVDLKRRTKIPTFLKKVIQQNVKLENLGEELRVLYVAMTRAKEKLILTGQLPDAENVLEEITWQNRLYGENNTEKNKENNAEKNSENNAEKNSENNAEKNTENNTEKADGSGAEGSLGRQDGALPFYILSKARSYLDWVLPAVCGRNAPIRICIRNCRDGAFISAAEEQGEQLARNVLEHWDAQRVYDPVLKERLEEQAGFTYPFENARKLKMKFTVSELKKRAYLSEESGVMAFEEPDVIPLIPQFLQEEEELTGASRGSAYHKLLELLDFSREYDREILQRTLDRLEDEKKLSKEMADCIRINDILGFLNCPSGQRMHRAAKDFLLYKEQPFVLGVDAQEIYPGEAEGETILIQGIIDVYFEEDGELVVLDYKTDKVKNAEELKEKYHSQLEYYAEAMEQLLKKHVKEKIIYSFTLKQEIQV